MALVYVVDQKLLHRIKRVVCGRTSLLEVNFINNKQFFPKQTCYREAK